MLHGILHDDCCGAAVLIHILQATEILYAQDLLELAARQLRQLLEAARDQQHDHHSSLHPGSARVDEVPVTA